MHRSTPSIPPVRPAPTAGNEQGFVLISVLLVLFLFTAMAMIAARMATQQLRTSGGLHGSVAAYHAAEGGASWVVNGFSEGSLGWAPDDGIVEGAELGDLFEGLPHDPATGQSHGAATWWVESMNFEGDRVTFVVAGRTDAYGGRLRRMEVEYARGEPGSSSPFAGAVVGCDGVTLSGSGWIDSWDSSMGAYDASLRRAGATVGTIAPDADIVLSGSSPIHGDVWSARDIRLSGSAQVHGAFRAVRDIRFTGNPSCPTGVVEAGGTIQTPGAWWCGNPSFDEGVAVPAPTDQCDPLDVVSMVADSAAAWAPTDGQFTPWPHTGWRANPVHIASNQALQSFSIGPGAHPVTMDAGAIDHLYINGNFSLTSSAQLHIQNPSIIGTPQTLRIFVNGDISAAGASQLRIDPGVSVQFFTNGRVNFTGGHGQTIPPTVNLSPSGTPEIAPTLAIYSSWVGNRNGQNSNSGQAGIQLGGSSPLSASVYAPHASIQVAGSSRLYGAVRGRWVGVSGNASIHYDEALGLMSGGAAGASTAARVIRWAELR